MEQLRQMHQDPPLRLFRVHVADGRYRDLVQAEFLAHPPTERTVMIARPDGSVEVIDLLFVTSFGPINGEPGSRTD